jgi:hypothetical protein
VGILADSVLTGGVVVAVDADAVATKFAKNLINALLYGSLVYPEAFSPLSYSEDYACKDEIPLLGYYGTQQ